MSVSSFSDEILTCMLSNSEKLFLKMELKLSSKIVGEMLQIIKNTIPHIDKNKLSSKFIELQDSIEVEFSKKSKHYENVIKQLQKSVRKTIKYNLSESHKTFETSSRYEKMDQRKNSWRIVELLRRITLKGSTDDEEKLIGISFAYLGLINGIYRLSLQDCYAWHRLGEGDSVDPQSLKNMEVADIYDYFNTKKLPMHYFNGLDLIVRNAVGHSNFHYDKDKQRMIYVDQPKNSTKVKISEYNFLEMAENYTNLEVVYHAVLLLNQESLISTSCDVLTKRYP